MLIQSIIDMALKIRKATNPTVRPAHANSAEIPAVLSLLFCLVSDTIHSTVRTAEMTNKITRAIENG